MVAKDLCEDGEVKENETFGNDDKEDEGEELTVRRVLMMN